MKKHTQLKFLLLSACLLFSVSFQHMKASDARLLPSISFDSFTSFIKEHPLFLFFGATLGVASYHWYKYKYLSKPIKTIEIPSLTTSTSHTKPCITSDGKIVHIDPRDLPTCTLKTNLQNSYLDELTIPHSREEIRLLIFAISLINNDLSLLKFSNKELDILQKIAKELNIQPILKNIQSIKLSQRSEQVITNQKTLTTFLMPKILASTQDSPTSLYRDIMTIDIAARSKQESISRDKLRDKYPYQYADRYFYTQSHCIVLKYHESEKPWSLIGNKRPSRGTYSTEIYTKDRSQLLKTIDNGIACSMHNPYCDSLILLPQTNSCILHETDTKQTKIAKWRDGDWSEIDQTDYDNASRWILYNFDTQEQYILPIAHRKYPVISANEKFIACKENDGVYLLNISKPDDIKKLKLLDSVRDFCFDNDSTQLATIFGGTIELWDLEKIDWNSQQQPISKTIVCPHITNTCSLQFHNKIHLRINNYQTNFMGEYFTNQYLMIDLNNPQNTYSFPEFTTDYIDQTANIYLTQQKKSNKITDYLAFKTDKNPTDKFQLFSDKGKKLYSQLITHYKAKPSDSQLGKIDLLFSANRQWCATISPFSLLQQQDNGTFIEFLPVKHQYRILQLNNDGSYILQTNCAIEFYNNKHECETIIDCVKNGKFPYKAKLKNQHIVCSYTCPKGSRFGEGAQQISWQLPSATEQNAIHNIVSNLTPLQYTFIRDMCTQHKKSEKEQPTAIPTLSIRPQSLQEGVFRSFKPADQETLKSALHLSIS